MWMMEMLESLKLADNPSPIQSGVGADTVHEIARTPMKGSAGQSLVGREIMKDFQVERQACTQAVKAVLVDSFQYLEKSSTAEM